MADRALEARLDFRAFVSGLASQQQNTQCVAEFGVVFYAPPTQNRFASFDPNIYFDIESPGYDLPALNDNAGPVIADFEMGLSEHGSFVYPLEFDNAGGASAAPGGLGDLSQQDASAVDITGGIIRGVTLIDVDVQGASVATGVLTETAANTLSGHRVVKYSGSRVAYADPATIGDAELVVGITTQAAQGGDAVVVRYAEEMVEPTWTWSPGPVFCGPQGQLTQVPPLSGAWLRQIGVAITATRLLVQLRSPTYL